MHPFKKIAIHHPPGIAIWDPIIRGIFKFARPDLPWLFSTNFGNNLERIANWKPDGAIVQCNSEDAAKFLKELNIPVVNIARVNSNVSFPSIQIDDFAVGKMAANYFLAKGFENFGCYSLKMRNYMQSRVAGFKTTVDSNHKRFDLFLDDFSLQDGLPLQNLRLASWLEQLPKPVGIFATTDALGLDIISNCRLKGLSIPEDLSVVGVSNNELLCNLAFPPLSSVQLPGEKLGFKAAELLRSIIDGNQHPNTAERLQPVGIVNRKSSDKYCVEDLELNLSIQFVQQNFGLPINATSVVKASGVSRSALERKFRQLLGRTILEEITFHRIKEAKHLLTTTDQSIQYIATSIGFSSSRQFSTSFKKHTGLPPRAFRNRFRC